MKNVKPIICMERDKKAVQFCLDRIAIGEPCSVVGMEGNGQTMIYETLIQKLKDNHKNNSLFYVNAQTDKELSEFLEQIKKQKSSSMVCVVNVSTEKDSSWFIEELDDLRDKMGVGFTPIIISDIEEVLTCIVKKQKILCRSMFVLKPISFEDAVILVSDFERRFSFKPTGKQILDIYKFSGGHVGLIKSFYLMFQTSPDIKLNTSEVLSDISITSRLHGIVRGLPVDITEAIVQYPENSRYDYFLVQFGFVKKNVLFSPLLGGYLKEKSSMRENKNLGDVLLLELTISEFEIFKLLEDGKNKIVDRELIAKHIWKSDWEEQYSEWAIDQIVHRIREKLLKVKAPYEILTKKGVGFVLREK